MLTRVVKLAEEDGWIQVAIIADGMQLQSLSKRIERVGFGDEADAKVLACSFGPRDTKNMWR
ncbi:hypothetical protein JQ557_32130 [Bradyrhizobium sp. U87765 SZCCT0131]|uniref:hypothetical protein n=1 Tax=unclassified Bradyrhizobium TaxID=2631580 RepID=UPI001BA4843C|nr:MULTISPECIES: hypothetical protein [unclassified Bradyrhizobium]MBR1222687.1 hypothetical protein [Bradyrhizobium sp. U87765 SZCCT0131]MBR1265232.1 hypothetical protein [Bradyrhizobium sp. U87765 SZCCT0134]MBR1302989.1 hypothetical protein [Bradyrhizobium sp. U87765 SZCCT0110]MBR1323687.1 hypothetical protein [Bradyrhizobium sp. U87765 SZCCT0109]MBR1346918.1 hypothetical protein [Bradyrhizobium sp. U87765 SZCCT0048]